MKKLRFIILRIIYYFCLQNNQIMKFVYRLAFASLILFTACKKEKSWDVDVKEQNVKLAIHDISQDFFNDSIPLVTLRKNYPFFFDTNSDEIWEAQRRDKKEINIYTKSRKIFGNFDQLNNSLVPVFQRYQYYFPEYKIPTVYTYSSGLQNLNYPVMFSQQSGLLFIAMDAYLGTKEKLYDSIGVDRYLRANMELDRLPSQTVDAIANDIVTFSPRNQLFIDHILYEGKKLILQDALLADTPDEYKLGYSPEQIQWCIDNEGQIWNFFVEQNYVFSSDVSLKKRFLDLAPFSKFNNEIEQNSPGRIGAWVGLQIIRQYLRENPKVELKTLLEDMDAQKIFKDSKYKPALEGKSGTVYTTKTINGKDYHFVK